MSRVLIDPAIGASSGRSGPRPRSADWRIGMGLVIAALALLIARVSVAHSSLGYGITSCALAALGAVVLVTSPRAGRSRSRFLPLSFIAIWTVAFVIASSAWREPTTLMALQARGLNTDYLAPALAVTTVALLSWTAGFLLLRFRLAGTMLSAFRRWATEHSFEGLGLSLHRVLFVYIVGLAARLLTLLIGRYEYITSDLEGAVTRSSPLAAVLGNFELFTSIAILLLATGAFSRASSRWNWALAVVLIVEVPFGLLSGMRSFVLLRFLAVGVVYVFAKRRVPKTFVVIGLTTLALLTPFSSAYREAVRGQSGTKASAGEAASVVPRLLGETMQSLDLHDIVMAPLDFASGRLRMIDEVAIVVQRSPSEIEHIPAHNTILEAAGVMVPRALWPGKPVYTVGIDYARDFWHQPESVVSARSPTFPGEAYYRGGWSGVVVIMFGLGGLMSAFARAFDPRTHPGAIPLFLTGWMAFLNLESSLVLLGAGLTQSLLITGATVRFVSASSGMKAVR